MPYALLRASLIDQWIPDHSKRGMDAHNHPDFYRQIGKDPEQIVAEGLENLATRFNLQK